MARAVWSQPPPGLAGAMMSRLLISAWAGKANARAPAMMVAVSARRDRRANDDDEFTGIFASLGECRTGNSIGGNVADACGAQCV